MPLPSEADILRFIAREEPLTDTVRAFRGVTREHLGQVLEALAARLDGAAPAPPAKGPYPRLRLFTDGAARGNPGPSGAGAVLLEPGGQVVARLGKYLGVQTNNHAEYTALLLGLQHAKTLGARELEVFSDSELLVRQLTGRYQVRSPTLRPLYEEALRLLKDFAQAKVAHVPREENGAADEMSNRAIDERL
ncbi:ribonuclease HI family protein [Myxococcaceae bacterium GXIMD 01537]